MEELLGNLQCIVLINLFITMHGLIAKAPHVIKLDKDRFGHLLSKALLINHGTQLLEMLREVFLMVQPLHQLFDAPPGIKAGHSWILHGEFLETFRGDRDPWKFFLYESEIRHALVR